MTGDAGTDSAVLRDDASRDWYLVHLRAHQEQLAAEHLARQGYAV